jgi:hypothetical protein
MGQTSFVLAVLDREGPSTLMLEARSWLKSAGGPLADAGGEPDDECIDCDVSDEANGLAAR